MKVVTDSNETIDLGVTETSATISITDYSRRVTDDFGVTTVVPRKFARRLSIRMRLETSAVDAVHRRLAGLRAVPANWIAGESLAWLAVRGFFKDFEIDVADARSSFCTLSVEGLAESETVADNGIEPAPAGSTSSLRLLQPVAVTGSTLVSSNVPENDYPAWSSANTYGKGARVILASTHRVYESADAGNVGNDPSGASGRWIDIGPTNRWAMFDEALGTSTIASGSVSVVLNGSATTAIALVDVTGASVRVQASGYDRTQAAGAGAIVFADLPSVTGQITVTTTGSGAVAVGTLLIGRVVGLGITEASPTAGITDYSRKVVDDFGEVSVVQRAWAKRMSARALLRTEAVDQVANWIASVRARPCLWIADSALDAVTIYGFFKDFSIEVGERVSKLSLSVEGLSKAAPAAATGPGGSTGLTPRGNYDSSVVYSEGDVVLYQGSSWYFIAETPSSGHAPPAAPATEDAYWRILARAGTGEPGKDGASAFTLVPNTGTTYVTANSVDGTSGSPVFGSDAAYTAEAFNGGAVLSFSFPPAHGDYIIAGLTQGNGIDRGNSSDSVTFGFYRNPDNGETRALINGAQYGASGPTVTGRGSARIQFDGRYIRWYVNGAMIAQPYDWMGSTSDPYAPQHALRAKFVLAGNTPRFEQISLAAAGAAGADGADAPLLRVQWSIDGVSNWHDNYMGADVFQRQSTDGGLTWGPAYRVIGESGTVGQDGSFTSFVFRRSATIPAAPADNSGNPPAGWTDGPPAGTDFLWQSKATFRGATQLTSWTTPARISGDDGFGVKVTPDNFQQAVFSTGANKPSWTGGQGTITLNKGGQIITSGVTYSLSAVDGVANLSLSGNVFTFSGAIGDSGTFVARAHYNGQTYEARVTVQKVYDGEPAFKGSVGFGSGGGSASLVVPAGRQCVISGSAQYSITGSGLGNNQQRMSVYWSNKTDGGPLNFLGSADGTVAYRRNVGTPSDPVIEAQAGTVSASFPFTAPSPSKEITYTIVVEPIVAQAPASVIGSGGLEVRS
ncbi:hypothetical protein [Sphingomonas sp. BK235]|uniref:hypothetical protein n=1 Tax=Sphingomonas sp. BK235 TaxID=2512131 RepID=UPI0010465331|nr:hypothetical protein [Sphingomonas sp. BK235]TCP36554.1 hypothetical protein EV292_10150 [Sphingomonas sp. BK235]